METSDAPCKPTTAHHRQKLGRGNIYLYRVPEEAEACQCLDIGLLVSRAVSLIGILSHLAVLLHYSSPGELIEAPTPTAVGAVPIFAEGRDRREEEKKKEENVIVSSCRFISF